MCSLKDWLESNVSRPKWRAELLCMTENVLTDRIQNLINLFSCGVPNSINYKLSLLADLRAIGLNPPDVD